MQMKTIRDLILDVPLELTSSEKLMLLALAFYCDDQGGNIYPSVELLAVNAGVGRSQAQKILKALERKGLLKTVAREKGGPHHATKIRRLNLARLRELCKPWWAVKAAKYGESSTETDPVIEYGDTPTAHPE